MRRTKATLVYRKTKNLRAAQLLLGHTKLEYLFSNLDKVGATQVMALEAVPEPASVASLKTPPKTLLF